jgi:hypothetical protein
MKIEWSFPKQILLTLVISAVLGFYPLSTVVSGDVLRAAVIGTLLTTINVLLGYAAIEYSIGKSTTTFFKFVLGGMGIRLVFMAGILIVLVKGFGMHVLALIGSIGIFYVIFLTLEIFYIQKKISTKHQN